VSLVAIAIAAEEWGELTGSQTVRGEEERSSEVSMFHTRQAYASMAVSRYHPEFEKSEREVSLPQIAVCELRSERHGASTRSANVDAA
jgi:hypothetical protein